MYSDLIDSVKTITDDLSLIRAETFLFHSILNGYRPTLTLTQAMDSAVILAIARNAQQSSFFLKAIEEGYIRVSLYSDAKSLQGYLLKTLQNVIKEDSSKFKFSNMPFLYNEDMTDKQRLAVYRALKKQISEGNPTFDSKVLAGLEREYVEEYVDIIRKINFACRQSYLQASLPAIELKDVLKQRINERLVTVNDNEEIKSILTKIQSQCVSNYRSFYYNLLKCEADNYSDLVIQEVRQLIDYSYNEIVASSINDNEPANLNIPNSFPELAASVTGFQNTKTLSNNEILINDEKREYLTWENLLGIMKEIRSIQNKKKGDWKDALQAYISSKRLAPFSIGLKYLGISTLTTAISSVPILGTLLSNLGSELLWSCTCDLIGEAAKKPSIGEIVKSIKESNNKCKLLKMADSQSSIYTDKIK